MTEVVSVKFKSKGKVYYFDPAGEEINKGEHVIVETLKGLEYAECVRGNHEVDESAVIPPLRPVIRVATEEDIQRAKINKEKEAEAFEICKEKIKNHDLDMKLVDVEYSFEGNKILFCFTSDGRVDFRELVKDLAATFKMRIELRQIGVRDEARLLGGLGICGKPFCCAQFLDDFQPVSIKMAKTQGLSLNPTKISGTCGRLMCCLKYEQDAYEDLAKKVPKIDAFVDTPDGKGSVTDVNLLRSRVRVKLENQADLAIKTYEADEISVLGGKAQRNEYLQAVAEGRIVEEPRAPRPAAKPRPEPVHEELDPMPELIIKNPLPETEAEPAPEVEAEKQRPRRDRRMRRGRDKARTNEKPAVQEQPIEPAAKEQEKEPAKQEKSEGTKTRRNHRGGRGRNKNAAQPKPEQAAPQPKVEQTNQPQQNKDGGEKKTDQKQNRRRPYYRRRNSGKKQQNKANNE